MNLFAAAFIAATPPSPTCVALSTAVAASKAKCTTKSTAPLNNSGVSSFLNGLQIASNPGYVIIIFIVLLVVCLIYSRQYQQNKGKHRAVHNLRKNNDTKRWFFERKYAEISFIFVGILSVIVLLEINVNHWPTTTAALPIALWTVWLGYSQFIDVRNESSIDKFYERINITNRKLDEWENARKFAGPWYNDSLTIIDQEYDPVEKDKNIEQNTAYQLTMYVCLDLDNIESAIVKYQAGYMSSSNVYRSIETFTHRCAYSAAFREIARTCLDSRRGYHAVTKAVVDDILEECRKEEWEVSAKKPWPLIVTKDRSGTGLKCPICSEKSVEINKWEDSSVIGPGQEHSITFKASCKHRWKTVFSESNGRLVMETERLSDI